MALFTNAGLNDINDYVLGITVDFSMTLRLYVNTYVPSLISITANFVELSNTLYTPVALTAGNWTGGTANGLTNYQYAQQTFSFPAYTGAPLSICGYFITNANTGNTVAAEAAISPYLIPYSGGSLQLLLNWLDENM